MCVSNIYRCSLFALESFSLELLLQSFIAFLFRQHTDTAGDIDFSKEDGARHWPDLNTDDDEEQVAEGEDGARQWTDLQTSPHTPDIQSSPGDDGTDEEDQIQSTPQPQRIRELRSTLPASK